MFYQESLEYFLNHKFGFSLNEASKLAHAESSFETIDDARIRIEHEDDPDLSWADGWENEVWMLRQINKRNLGCYVVFLEKKRLDGTWEKIDVVGGIICHENDLRVYETEIIRNSIKKL